MEHIEDKKPNYKIYCFKDSSLLEKDVIVRFYAKDDATAYAYLENYKNIYANDDRTLYYATIHYISSVDSNGNKSPEVDIEDRGALSNWIHGNDPWYKKIWEEIKDFFEYWLIDRPKDFYYWLRDLRYLLKNKEAYSNQWNLDWHLLDSIERNVPSLIENSYALAFLDEAIIQAYGNEPGFDINKFYRENCTGYPKEIEDLAIKIQNEEYKKLLLYVKLYKYYANFGDFDTSNPEEVAFDKEWRHTLPIKKGTYNEIADHKQLIDMAQTQWNNIWDWMKKYGQKLND